jgi:hypothetical protein
MSAETKPTWQEHRRLRIRLTRALAGRFSPHYPRHGGASIHPARDNGLARPTLIPLGGRWGLY